MPSGSVNVLGPAVCMNCVYETPVFEWGSLVVPEDVWHIEISTYYLVAWVH